MKPSRFEFTLLFTLLLGVMLPVACSMAFHLILPEPHWILVPLHSVVEALGAFAGVSLAALLLLLGKYKKDFAHHLWTCSALLSMGVLDGFHASVMPGAAFVWLRSTGTLTGGLFFALVWLPERATRMRFLTFLPGCVLLTATLFGIFSVRFADVLPTLVSQGDFTATAQGMNLIGGLGFLAATAYFLNRHRKNGVFDEVLFAVYCLLFGMAALLFKFSELWKADWWAWHFLRLGAYFIVLGHTFLLYRQTQEALQASEKRFRTLSTSSPIGIFQTDAEGLGIYANERCLAILGLVMGETIGHGWTKSVHPEDRDKVFAEWMTAAHAGRDFSREYRVLTREGKVIWVHARAAALPSDDDGLYGHVGTIEDVSGRRLAEKELRESEVRFRMLARATNDAVRDWDLVTNGLWMSDCVESLFGYPGDGVGPDCTWWSDRVHPEDWEWIEPSLRTLLDGDGSFWSGEYRFRHEDGSYLDVFDRGYVIRDEAMRPVRMIGSMMDVSARKRGEAEIIKARQAAEAANGAKSEFLANMSHEIRTPMNGVLGMLDLTLRSSLQPRQREFLTLAKSSAETLLRLLNDILDFSKIEAGRLELESTPFSLREALGDTLKSLALQVHEKGLELTHAVSPDVPDAVVGDPGRLSQILVNLVGNAQKFTDRGEVVVRVELGARVGGSVDLSVSVRDTGVGIPLEKQAHVFAAFAQADGSTTRQFGGTGLGLTICSHLVRAMGGCIWVESVVGQGSTFHFTARLGLQEGGAARSAPIRVNLDGLPVLVVDDNATHRLVVGELVSAWGMKPTTVDGGPAAIAAMRHAREVDEPYSLVLLDVLMPGMDGFEVAEWIQRDAELAGTAIMMLSSADYRGDAGRCRAVGAAAFLRKPIKESELLDAILEVLGLATPARAGSPSEDAPAPPPPSVRLRILLAEDAPINQRLAITLLEDRGHAVVVANDGREALDVLERESFDLILMDVQMPRMDGFEATAAIRAKEEGTGRRIPILAMTAHAMKGDRERCLAAGMDGYISKPIRAEQFLATVEGRSAAAAGPEPEGGRGPQPEIAATVFDLPGALARSRGKRPLLRKMAELFLADCPRLVDQVRAALAAGDAPTLERAAHRLKGSAGNLSAPRVVAVAGRLEEIGRDGQFAGADAACAELEIEIVRLGRALETLNHEDAACVS